MNIKNVQFITSVGVTSVEKDFNLSEIAFAGKSNVGKSSLINYLSGAKVARTSKEPGRTRLLNYFLVNNDATDFYLVDLPGYGYAEVSDAEKIRWSKLLENYLSKSKNLKNVFILIDIRRTPSNEDLQLERFLLYYHIPYSIICTKADKIKKSELPKLKKNIADTFKISVDSLIVTSSEKNIGRENVLNKIEELLNKTI